MSFFSYTTLGEHGKPLGRTKLNTERLVSFIGNMQLSVLKNIIMIFIGFQYLGTISMASSVTLVLIQDLLYKEEITFSPIYYVKLV